MKERFDSHIKTKFPELIGAKVYVAVSGGVDSMVLLSLINSLLQDVTALHCNFKLRDGESDKDEELVKVYCEESNIGFLSKVFDVNAMLEKKGGSVQVLAREARYNWFEGICGQPNTYLLTAHHQNDVIETFFINLARGAGVKGLASIPDRRAHICRPFLPFSKSEIAEFAEQNGIPWREDVSNSSSKYLRNKIRNVVLPLLEDVKPGFESSVLESVEFLRKSSSLEEEVLNDFSERRIKHFSYYSEVNLEEMTSLELKAFSLYLLRLGYVRGQNESVFESLTNVGKRFFSKDYELVVGRQCCYIFKVGIQYYSGLNIPLSGEAEQHELSFSNLSAELVENKGDFKFQDKYTVYMKRPLSGQLVQLRSARSGDSMRPLGMRGVKKLSDIFIDEKWSEPMKRTALVVEVDGEIAWLAGFRVSENWKVDEESDLVLKLSLQDK